MALTDQAALASALLGAATVAGAWWLGRASVRRQRPEPREAEYTLDPPAVMPQHRGSAPIGLWIWEPEKDLHWWSSDLYKMIGAPLSEDASTELLLRSVHSADASALMQTLRLARHEQGQGRCEVRFEVENTIRRLALEFSERPESGEHSRRIVGSLQDVTDQVTAVQVERVRAAREQRFEAALLRAVRSEEVLHADPTRAAELLSAMTARLLECLTVSYWLRDRDTGVLSRVASEPRDPKNLVTWKWKSLHPKESSEIFASKSDRQPMLGVRVGPGLQTQTRTCLLVPSRASGEQIGTLRLERGDGATWADDEIDFAEEISNLMAQVVMVAKNRHLEVQLRQSQKMESIGQLAGAVAHDFNNMLTSILGYSELLAGELPEASPLQDDVKEILRSGERAKSLTRQLLAFSRLQPMDQISVELNHVIANLEKMLGLVLDERITLRIELQAVPSVVCIDVALFEQVVLNLVLNSRDAMPEGGNLWLRTYLARPQLGYPEETEVVLSIRDDGNGIPHEMRDRIFEPFFTTKDKDKGTGLGLSTAYGIIKQSRGDLRLASTSDQGTTFEVRLPIHLGPSSVGHTSLEDEPVPSVRGETALVVEDDLGVLRLATRTLREAGYTVLEASSGEQAIALCKAYEGTISVLLSDVVMPGLSGGELADILTKDHPLLPVLFMSGFNEDRQVRKAVESRNADYISKPFTPAELLAQMSKTLSTALQRAR